jgi:hypothetical protein
MRRINLQNLTEERRPYIFTTPAIEVDVKQNTAERIIGDRRMFNENFLLSHDESLAAGYLF